jgi:N-acetylneuraminic acid mutarotase
MKRALFVSLIGASFMHAMVGAQQGGLNTPVLPGLPRDPSAANAKLTSDLLQQRQVEPDIVVSTRNPLHLMAFFNDYRAVDLAADGALPGKQSNGGLKGVPGQLLAALKGRPGKPAIPSRAAAAEATVGLSRSYDGGLTWTGALLPGSIDDTSPASLASPVYGLDAMTDPKTAAAPCGIAYVAFIAFTRGGQSKVAVARYQDVNTGGNDTWFYQGTSVLQTGHNASNGPFHDLPAIMVDPVRTGKVSDPCAHNVYVGWATFTGTDGASKLNFAKTTSGNGSTWNPAWSSQYVGTPDMTNQAVAIAVDPRPGAVKTGGGGTIYYGWRSFATASVPAHMWISKSTDYGGSFSKAVAVTGASPLYTFDQPSLTTSNYPYLAFRSNALPTLEVVPHPTDTTKSTVFMAWQERVKVACPSASCGFPAASGDPRIVLTSSADGNVWTPRRAVDIGDRDVSPDAPAPGFGYLPLQRSAGGQVMPRLSFGGGRLALFYYETRGPMVIPPGNPGFIADVDQQTVQQLDARLALLDLVDGHKLGTNQISRYPIKFGADLQQETLDDILDVAPGVKAVNNRVNRPNSGGGTTPFIGDYIGITPIVRFVPDANGMWKWATKPADVPFPGFRTVFADTRNQIPPASTNINEYQNYSPPGTNSPPCVNPGSRNHDVMHALVNASVAVNAATTFKQSTIQRAFPVTLTNGLGIQQFYRLTFDRLDVASWDQFDPSKDVLDIELFPYSSSTRVVYVSNTAANGPIKVSVNALMLSNCSGTPSLANCTASLGAAVGNVTLNLDPTNPNVSSGDTDETHNPLVSNPLVSNPLVSNPLVSNLTAANPLVSNPLVSNPLVSNPLVSNSTVYDITDVTWTVQNGGNTNSAYLSQIAVANAAALQGSYAFQLLIYKKSMSAGLDGCNTTNVPYDQIISSIPNPLVSNPLVSNPLVSNPLVSNPLVSNATFNVAPPDGGSGGITQATAKLAAAKPGPGGSGSGSGSGSDDGTTHDTRLDEVFVTLRAYQLVPAPPVKFDPISNPPGIAVSSEAANVINGVIPPAGTQPPTVIKFTGTTFVVTNTNDSGTGSLRAVISAANSLPGRDTIIFNIPGPGPYTINLSSALPQITDAVVLDATIQPGFNGAPVVILDGAGLSANGLTIAAGSSVVRGLVIHNFAGNGVHIIDGSNNIIGGSTSPSNVISGNAGEGVRIDGALATGNVISGNYIGTDAFGTAALGNSASGIYIRKAPGNSVIGNVVSGNLGFAGVAICGSDNPDTPCGGGDIGTQTSDASGNVVQGNLIGTDASGSGALGNSGYGVSIDGAPLTEVGGTTPGAGNVIANSGLAGVVVFDPPTSGNQIVRNSIYSNGGLGIDLGANGVTFNDGSDGPKYPPYDADAGPNGLQNFPELTSAVISGGVTTVNGILRTTASTAVAIDLYYSTVCDPSGYGQGQTWFKSISGLQTDAVGDLPFTTSVGIALPAGVLVTATATTAEGTSEFSGCRMALAPGFADWPVFQGGNGHVYEYVQSPGTWTAANAAAPTRSFRGVAGHLATITSFDENDVVGSLRGTDNDLRGWIGLTDSATEGTFLWVTGEPFSYSNWNAGEPNNGVGLAGTPPEGEDFVEIFAAKVWNDNWNGTPDNKGYVVEYDVNPTQVLTGSSWAPLVSMPTARSSLQGAAANGLLYAVGGSNGSATPIVEAYNPASNVWSTVASLNAQNYGGQTGRYVGSAVGVNGKVYMMGGWTNSPPLPSNTLSIYDPATNAWTSGPTIPGSGYTACSEAAVIGSKIYLLNACNGYDGYVQQLSIFDTVANFWTTGPNAPRNHNAGLGAALNGKFYVTGGTDGGYQPQVDVYDPAANTWTTVVGGSMPVNLWSMAGDVFDGKWYIVGGSDATTNFKNTLWIYDPAANTWTSGPAAPTARSGAAAATINGRLYVVGGYNSTGYLSTLEVFDPNASGAAWSSGTLGVAMVDSNGLATGVSAGQSTITATAGSISGNTTLTVASPDAITPITVTIFNDAFTGDPVNQPPNGPVVGTWTMATTNGSVLVRSSSGNLVANPVEVRQFGGTNSVSLQGNVSTPPITGIWKIRWNSLMADPGTGYPGFIFAPVVVRGNGGIIASVEYR